MKDILIKYLDSKIKYATKKLKIDEFFELKDLENFLCLLMDVQDELGPKESLELSKNKKLIQRINSKYKLIKPNILEIFISQIEELSRRSPSFTANNYTFVLDCFRKILSNEEILYKKYDELFNKIEKIEKENEDLTLNKMWLEEVKSKIENEIILTDTAFIDYIYFDKLINTEYKMKLIKNVEEFNKEALKNYVPASLEEISNLLKDYGYKITDEDYLVKISTNYKLSVLKNILDTIKEKKLKFEDDVIKKILAYGTSVSTINGAYEKVLNNANYQLNAVSKIHNFWIDRTYEKDTVNREKSSIFSNKIKNPITRKNEDENFDDYELNSSEIFETAEYLKKFPFYNSSFTGMKTILKLPIEKLMKRENLLSLYGIDANDIEGSMTLFAPYNITLLDQFLELDLKDYILIKCNL